MSDDHFTHVSKTATCKRCGSTNVTWQRSAKGKWFLTEVFSYPRNNGDADERTGYTDFHSAYCGKPEIHEHKQNEIILTHQRERMEADKRADELEQERINDEAIKLTRWYAMTPEQQSELIADLESEIELELRGITMDYFTEYCQAIARAEALRAEISMYLSDDDDLGIEC